MVSIENAEQAEMKTVANTISPIANTIANNRDQQQINVAVQAVTKVTQLADQNELKQQAAAVKARTQV